MIVGALEIQLAADVARLSADMRRAQGVVDQATSAMGRAAGLAKGALGAIAGVLSINAFAGWVKGAIDATDAVSDISQRTGVAIKDIAGLQLWFQKGGAEAGAFESTMVKLSKELAEGGAAFQRLGIRTRDANGSLRSNVDVLLDSADAFAKMQDGTAKTALAVELFSKTGANLIPMLNEGSEGLREMMEMADKLGLTFDQKTVDAAGSFNDTLDFMGLAAQGVGRQVAAQLLPTLNSVGGSLLNFIVKSDGVRKAADVIGTGFKIIYTAGVSVMTVFDALGKIIGGSMAFITNNLGTLFLGLKQAIEGNYSDAWRTITSGGVGAATILTSTFNDVKSSLSAAATTISDVWTGAGGESIAALSGMQNKSKHLTDEERKRAAKAIETAEDFIKAQQKEREAIGLTEDQQRMLTAARTAAIAPTEKQRMAIMANALAITTERQAWERSEAARKAAEDAIGQDAQTLLDLDKRIAGLELEIRLHGKTANAAIDAELAKAYATASSLAISEEYRDELQKQTAKLEEIKRLQGKLGDLDAAKKGMEDAAGHAERMADRMGDAITDSLMRGFESGKSFAANMWSTIINMAKTEALTPFIKGVVGAGLGALGFGSTASAATGSAAGSAAGGIASGLGLGGIAASIGTGAMQTAGAWLTGQIGFGSTLSAGLGAIGTGTMSGITAGLSSVVGVLGPIALGLGAAVAIWKKLDTSGTYHTGGASSASAAGVGTIRAESLNFERTRTNAEVEKLTAQLAQGVVGILDSTATAFGKTAGYTAATAFADDTSKDGAWGGLKIMLGDSKVLDWQDTRTSKWAPREFADGEAGRTQYLAEISKSVRTALDGIGLPSWAQKMLDGLGAGASLDEMANVVETINQTQVALKAMREQLVGFSGLSDGAVSALMTAAGGIQNLAGGAAAFYDNFYSEAEKSAVLTKQVGDALAAVGLQAPATKEAYRVLLEQQLAFGEAGAPAAAALFKNAQAFAQLHPELESTSSAAAKLADVNKGYQDQINEILRARMSPEEQRVADIQGMDPTTVALYDRLAALKLESAAMEKLAADSKMLQDQYDELTLTEAQRLAQQREALDPSLRARWDEIQAIKAQQFASEQAAAAIKAAAESSAAAIRSLSDGFVSGYERAKAAAQALREFNASLVLGNLSALDPDARYREAKKQFEASDGTDTQIVQAFLQASKDRGVDSFYYQRDFAAAQAKTAAAAVMMDRRAESYIDLAQWLAQGAPTYTPPVAPPVVVGQGSMSGRSAQVDNSGLESRLDQVINRLGTLETIASSTSQTADQIDRVTNGGAEMRVTQ